MSGKPEDDKTPVIETDDFDRGLIWRPTPDSGDENWPTLVDAYFILNISLQTNVQLIIKFFICLIGVFQ